MTATAVEIVGRSAMTAGLLLGSRALLAVACFARSKGREKEGGQCIDRLGAPLCVFSGQATRFGWLPGWLDGPLLETLLREGRAVRLST